MTTCAETNSARTTDSLGSLGTRKQWDGLAELAGTLRPEDPEHIPSSKATPCRWQRDTGVMGNMHRVLQDICSKIPMCNWLTKAMIAEPPQTIVTPVVIIFGTTLSSSGNPNLKEGVMSHPSYGNCFINTCFVHVSSLLLVTTAVE